MDRREMIERALGRFLGEEISTGWEFALDVLGLSREAIVIECEVGHFTPKVSPSGPYTEVCIKDDDGEVHSMSFDGLQGREGKAVAIIMAEE